MTSKKWSYRDLDNLLAGLEQDILDLDDRQMETRTERFFGSIRSVRDVVATGLLSLAAVDRPSTEHGAARARRRPETVPNEVPSIPVPGSFSEKRNLLAELFANSPGIPGKLRMAFSAPRTLSDTEVDAMVERLIRLGVFRRDGTGDDNA